MTTNHIRKEIKMAIWFVFLLALTLPFAQPTAAAPPQPPTAWSLSEVAPQGFNDQHNGFAWSMTWWRGHLYVGTGRDFACWQAGVRAAMFPGLASFIYPPRQPAAVCTADPADLPLQAEIWRWTPETDTWERVYQSPVDVPVPGQPGTFIARDTAYRGMLVFTEPDGTEALYVTAISPRALFRSGADTPPPRILRSVDGTTFEPLPQAPGSLLASPTYTSIRTGTIFNGRMYLNLGSARGEGVLIESSDPTAGNDSFRQVTPPGMQIWDAIPYNGFLYIGVSADSGGFSVVKTDALGNPPYALTPVITNGGYLAKPSRSVVSFEVHNGRLYVGTDSPAELYRINPDDTWDLIMGSPRDTSVGAKNPLSGLGAGFGWGFNAHVYRMHSVNGSLFMGTLDLSRDYTQTNQAPWLDALLRWHYGFDLYETVDGTSIRPLTITGFGDGFQVGLRTFASTPYGEFIGGANYWYGLRLWRASVDGQAAGPVAMPARVGVQSLTPAQQGGGAGQCSIDAPEVVAEVVDGHPVLVWSRAPGASRYRIFRSDNDMNVTLPGEVSGFEDGVPQAFVEAGYTQRPFFMDVAADDEAVRHYYVVAERPSGCSSEPSNLVRTPGLIAPITFGQLTSQSVAWGAPSLTVKFEMIRNAVDQGNFPRAAGLSTALRAQLRSQPPAGMAVWRARDLDLLAGKMEKRITLVQESVVPAAGLH